MDAVVAYAVSGQPVVVGAAEISARTVGAAAVYAGEARAGPRDAKSVRGISPYARGLVQGKGRPSPCNPLHARRADPVGCESPQAVQPPGTDDARAIQRVGRLAEDAYR